jgi:hypothetical protein
LKSVLIREIEVQSSEFELHVLEAAGKLLVPRLTTPIIAFSDFVREHVLIVQIDLCRKPRSQFGRSGDSELNQEAEKL